MLAVLLCAALVFGNLVPLALAAEAEGTPKEDEAKSFLEEEIRKAAVKAQHQLLSAERFFQSGKKRFEERNYEKAKEDFASALQLNPNHTQAKRYMENVKKMLGDTPEQQVLKNVRIEERVRVGRQKAKMLQLIGEGRGLLEEDHYQDAIDKLNEAHNIGRVLATRVDVAREQTEIGALLQEARESKEAAREAKIEKQKAESEAMVKAELERVRDLQDQRVTRLFEDAKSLYDDTRYLDAVRKCDEVMKIEPRHKEAAQFRDQCLDAQTAKDIKRYERDMKDETATTWRRVREQAVPYTDWRPKYPDNWEEIRKRTAGIQIEAETEEDAEWKKVLEAKLEEPVSFDFVATPLDDVVAFLHGLKRVNIVVDKAAIEDRRDNLDVTLRLQKVKFGDALSWILRLLDLNYTLENGAIYISTEEKIGKSKKTVTRFYDVTDLTVDLRNFKPNVQAISNADLDVDDMDDIFSEDNNDLEGGEAGFTGESLVEFIKSVIAPGSWAEFNDPDDLDI